MGVSPHLGAHSTDLPVNFLHLLASRFIRRISAVSNAIQTKDNEANHLHIYCLNCIRHGRNATYEPGLRDIEHEFFRGSILPLSRVHSGAPFPNSSWKKSPTEKQEATSIRVKKQTISILFCISL